jgi:2-polyprenyl-3-methyl-5-hydroxy-6-metoxy-1,4-benzoquinol methylase
MNNFGSSQHNLRKHRDKRAVQDIPLGVGAGSAEAEILRTSGLYGKATISTLPRHVNLNKLEGYKIMDFGCGSGRLSKMLAPHVRKVICADISENS